MKAMPAAWLFFFILVAMKDYYQILGVSYSASTAEIKRVYRRLAMMYHPDRNHSPEAEQMFKEINEAYDVLGNDENRRWYDFKLQSGYTQTLKDSYYQQTRHRDPAYHRRRTTKKPAERTESNEEKFAPFLPYFFWFNQIGVATMFLLIIDFVLPLSTSKEKIVSVYSFSNGSELIQGLLTTHAHDIKIDYRFDDFAEGDEIDLYYTPILKVIYESHYKGRVYPAKDHGIYGAIFIFPAGLFLTSFLGLVYRKNTEYAFNISIISAVLFIFVVIFLFTL